MKCRNCKNLGKLIDENGEPYDWCEKVCDSPNICIERNCEHFIRASKADTIRAMSDEELAEWIERIRKYCAMEDCGAECPLTDICYSMAASPTRTLEWLKREVAHE